MNIPEKISATQFLSHAKDKHYVLQIMYKYIINIKNRTIIQLTIWGLGVPNSTKLKIHTTFDFEKI